MPRPGRLLRRGGSWSRSRHLPGRSSGTTLATSSFSYGSTYEWDGVGWSQGGSAPPARWGFGLAFDAGRGRTVLHGGAWSSEGSPPTLLDDTWEYDGVSWQLAATGGPSPGGHPMAWDAAAGAVILVDDALAATLAWRGVGWERLGGVPAESRGPLASDPVGGRGAPGNLQVRAVLDRCEAERRWAQVSVRMYR